MMDDDLLVGIIIILSIMILVGLSINAFTKNVLKEDVIDDYEPINKTYLYKELNDNGLSEETYILNNESFEKVNVSG